MGKKKKDHRTKVARRNLRQEADAWDDLDKLYDKLEEEFDNPIKTLEENHELALALSPVGLRLLAIVARNKRKYGN